MVNKDNPPSAKLPVRIRKSVLTFSLLIFGGMCLFYFGVFDTGANAPTWDQPDVNRRSPGAFLRGETDRFDGMAR